jgi:acetyl-CoA C-acetyltransferase
MTSTDDIVIVAAARTPQGRLKGQLASFTAPQLGGLAIAGALARGTFRRMRWMPSSWVRCCRRDPGRTRRARQLAGGIGWDVPASSVNKVCLSGLTAIIDAKRMIASGDATVVVAGAWNDDALAAPAHGLARRLVLRVRRGARSHGVRRSDGCL